jgi:hypothetical protein
MRRCSNSATVPRGTKRRCFHTTDFLSATANFFAFAGRRETPIIRCMNEEIAMTVLSQRSRTRRDDAEPALDDLLNDGTLQALMARDGVDRPQLEALIGRTRRKLGLGLGHGVATAGAFEASLFAECGAL